VGHAFSGKKVMKGSLEHSSKPTFRRGERENRLEEGKTARDRTGEGGVEGIRTSRKGKKVSLILS